MRDQHQRFAPSLIRAAVLPRWPGVMGVIELMEVAHAGKSIFACRCAESAG